MLEFVRGDMLEAPADIRVNTVNCVGVMGAGVALAFKKRYPEMFRDYQAQCKAGQVQPGNVYVWRSLSGDWIINFPTKRDWRDPSRYEDIESGLDALREYLEAQGKVSVALPALGCGNGGLDWARVSTMIRDKLSDLSAHILVFEPDDSRKIGATASRSANEDEVRSAERLGYVRISDLPSLSEDLPPIYMKGDHQLLSQRWVALLPSRSPDTREMNALRAIAAELAKQGSISTVALVHGSRASEEIANVFGAHGINTVLLLPFGVLSRTSIAKATDAGHKRAVALLSLAPATEKWSRILFAQTIDLLRSNARAVLLSDSEAEAIEGKWLVKWQHLPISYVKYETMRDATRQALTEAGATPIGRRQEDGAPKIETLIVEHKQPALASGGSENLDRDFGNKKQKQRISKSSEAKAIDETKALNIDLADYPLHLLTELIDIVAHAESKVLSLTVRARSNAADHKLRSRLSKLGIKTD